MTSFKRCVPPEVLKNICHTLHEQNDIRTLASVTCCASWTYTASATFLYQRWKLDQTAAEGLMKDLVTIGSTVPRHHAMDTLRDTATAGTIRRLHCLAQIQTLVIDGVLFKSDASALLSFVDDYSGRILLFGHIEKVCFTKRAFWEFQMVSVNDSYPFLYVLWKAARRPTHICVTYPDPPSKKGAQNDTVVSGQDFSQEPHWLRTLFWEESWAEADLVLHNYSWDYCPPCVTTGKVRIFLNNVACHSCRRLGGNSHIRKSSGGQIYRPKVKSCAQQNHLPTNMKMINCAYRNPLDLQRCVDNLTVLVNPARDLPAPSAVEVNNLSSHIVLAGGCRCAARATVDARFLKSLIALLLRCRLSASSSSSTPAAGNGAMVVDPHPDDSASQLGGDAEDLNQYADGYSSDSSIYVQEHPVELSMPLWSDCDPCIVCHVGASWSVENPHSLYKADNCVSILPW